MIEPLCYGQDCLIVGSAPSLVFPEEEYGCIIGANGGAALAKNMGLEVDCLVTTSFLFRGSNTESEQHTISLLQGLSVQHIWVDTKSGPLERIEPRIAEQHVSWQEMYAVNPEDRNDVVVEAVGRKIWVSSGVWAACLAVASGAASVTMIGISLTNGHYGIEDTGPRDHILQDRLCLDLFKAKENVW